MESLLEKIDDEFSLSSSVGITTTIIIIIKIIIITIIVIIIITTTTTIRCIEKGVEHRPIDGYYCWLGQDHFK